MSDYTTSSDSTSILSPDPRVRAQYMLGIGLSVIPVEGKIPAIAWKDYQERLTSISEIDRWFHSFDLGVGIVTGRLSRLVVVDCDTEEAAAWASDHLPATPCMVRTRRGLHRYYRWPGVRVPNGASVRPGIDVRGDGGIAIAPGSPHQDGRYQIYGDLTAWTTEGLATIPVYDPTWLAPEPPVRRAPQVSLVDPDLIPFHQRLRQATVYIRAYHGAQEGCRNSRAYVLARTVINDFALDDSDEGYDLLASWADTCEPPMDDHEVQRVWRSALRGCRL